MKLGYEKKLATGPREDRALFVAENRKVIAHERPLERGIDYDRLVADGVEQRNMPRAMLDPITATGLLSMVPGFAALIGSLIATALGAEELGNGLMIAAIPLVIASGIFALSSVFGITALNFLMMPLFISGVVVALVFLAARIYAHRNGAPSGARARARAF